MLDAAREARSFAAGRTRADRDNDRQFALALVKAIEIIGEAAYHVSVETKTALTEIAVAQGLSKPGLHAPTRPAFLRLQADS